MQELRTILILLIGNELVNGSTKDKNAHFLLSKINHLPNLYKEIQIIPDDNTIIQQKLSENLGKFDLIITSGGLGPTSDDLSMEAIAKALEKNLIQDKESLARLKKKFKDRNRALKDNNIKQTFFPEGATILQNNEGTADACLIQNKDNSILACLPGVPREFKSLVDQQLIPALKKLFIFDRKSSSCHFRIFGNFESVLAKIIEGISLPQNIEIAYRPQFPEILVGLKSSQLNQEELDLIKNKLLKNIGKEFIISTEDEVKLPQVVFSLLKKSKKTLTLAESCTGGKIASEITSMPGCSDFFLGSIVCYSNSVKETALNIPRQTIDKHGAVSKEVVELMAKNTRNLFNSSLCVAVSGISGPTGSQAEKPIGLTYFAISDKFGTKVFKLNLSWDRILNQKYATWVALDLIRRKLLNFKFNQEEIC